MSINDVIVAIEAARRHLLGTPPPGNPVHLASDLDDAAEFLRAEFDDKDDEKPSLRKLRELLDQATDAADELEGVAREMRTAVRALRAA